jgi:hypothetical protein
MIYKYFKKSENIYKTKCLIFNKIYESISSLCNYNKKFNNIESVLTNQSNQHMLSLIISLKISLKISLLITQQCN